MSQRVGTTIFERDETRIQQINRTIVDSGIDITGFFGFFILGGSQIQESRKDFNTSYLASGAFKGAELTKLYSEFVGTGQSIITTPVTIKSTASVTFNNITFFQDHLAPSFLVKIESGAKATFVNCTFVRRSKQELRQAGGEIPANNSYVEVESAGAANMANFIGCKFIERAASGATEIFRRSAAAGTVFTMGCINQTGLGYGAARTAVGGDI
tara:strand:- start:242 stop:880 length:639 start_codon:yes stop_codon:yes gene_type:complete